MPDIDELIARVSVLRFAPGDVLVIAFPESPSDSFLNAMQKALSKKLTDHVGFHVPVLSVHEGVRVSILRPGDSDDYPRTPAAVADTPDGWRELPTVTLWGAYALFAKGSLVGTVREHSLGLWQAIRADGEKLGPCLTITDAKTLIEALNVA